MSRIYGWLHVPRRCACCGERVEAYAPMSAFFEEMYVRAGMVPWRSEMLNAAAYSCPHCGAADRERAYALCMERLLPHDVPFRMLDIAPAAPLGAFVKRVFPNAEYRTGDLFMEDVDYRLDIMDMKPIADASMDFFVCSHVLEHVTDDRRAMRELRRVLKPSGCGILVVPLDLNAREMDEDLTVTDEMERWRRFGQNDHVRKYTKRDFLQRLAESGLAVQACDRHFFGARAVWENSLSDTATVYIVRRA